MHQKTSPPVSNHLSVVSASAQKTTNHFPNYSYTTTGRHRLTTNYTVCIIILFSWHTSAPSLPLTRQRPGRLALTVPSRVDIPPEDNHRQKKKIVNGWCFTSSTKNVKKCLHRTGSQFPFRSAQTTTTTHVYDKSEMPLPHYWYRENWLG